MVFAWVLVFFMTEKEITMAATTIAAVSATHSTVTSPSSQRPKSHRSRRTFWDCFLTDAIKAPLTVLEGPCNQVLFTNRSALVGTVRPVRKEQSILPQLALVNFLSCFVPDNQR